MPDPGVCLSIVTFNSGRYIRRCLESALAQKDIRAEIVVVDNASTDQTGEILRNFGNRIRVIWNQRNVGFAEAQNQGIRSTRLPWVLTLNPDLLMKEDFTRQLVEAAEFDPGTGAVCGKLLSIGPGFEPLPDLRFDSTGIFFTPTLRHFDRGWHERDNGQYDRTEYVFGACAAAALYRRRMIDDVAIEGCFFDPISSPTARMPMSPGAPSCWAGAASTPRMPWAGTCAAWCRAIATRFRPPSICTR